MERLAQLPAYEERKKERESIDPRSIGIATTTRYPDWKPLPEGEQRNLDDLTGIRGDLALQTFRKAAEHGFQIALVDSPDTSQVFKSELTKLQDEFGIAVHQEKEKSTMSAGRRQALKATSALPDVKVIAWIEPEKESMVDNLIKAAAPILNGKVDIVTPKRNEALFEATYPAFQVGYEKRANERYNNLLEKTGLLDNVVLLDNQEQSTKRIDAWFGPRLMKNDPEVLEHFMHENTFDTEGTTIYEKTNPEMWPDTLFLSIPSALQAGLRVASVQVDYEHPALQTASEIDNEAMNEKRRVQHNTIIYSTIHALKRDLFDQSPQNLAAHPSQRSRLKKVA